MALHALIIDDNQANVDVLERALALEGITPYSVRASGAISATLQAMQTIDVVFLDLNLGWSNGLELIKELKQDQRLAHIPIVAYTVLISEQNEAYQAGFHSFLGKPLNLEHFPNQMRRILSGEQVWELNQ